VQEKLLVTGDAALAAIAAHLSEGIAALRRCVAFVIDRHSSDPGLAAAGAVPLLELFGIVAGGWQMARAALVARERLAQGSGDAAFLRAKLLTARFYADHVLAQAPGLAETVVGGAAAVLAYEDDQF